jgi:hypothetical protein
MQQALSPIERALGVLSDVSNLVISPYPALATRPGLTAVGAQVAAASVNGIHSYYTATAQKLLAHVGTGVYARDDGTGAWGSSLGTIANARSTAANINDLLIIFDGTNQRKYNGTTLAALGGTPPAGKYVISAYEQAFVAGMTARPADVDFCDDGDPETWSPASTNNAGSITIAQGDYITWLGFEKVVGKVTVWLRNRLAILNGPETGDLPSLWSVRVVSPHGTPNGWTVKYLGGGTWAWLTDEGFALWNGGDVEIAYDPIKTYFDTIDWSAIANASSWLDGEGRYWCIVPVTGSAYAYFCFDRKYGWFAGSGKTLTVSGSYRFSGKETQLVGDGVGNVYKVEGTDDAGTAISWSATVGPTMLDASWLKKEIVRVTPILSLASGGTANAYLSTAETGSYGTAQSITANTTITQTELPLPFAAGESGRSGIFRVKIAGTGTVAIHDMVLAHRRAGK